LDALKQQEDKRQILVLPKGSSVAVTNFGDDRHKQKAAGGNHPPAAFYKIL